ncbi:MAG: DciA family protein [Acidobacteriota bacterium]
MEDRDFKKMSEISRSIEKLIHDRSAAENLLLSKAWRNSCGAIIYSRTSIWSIEKDLLVIKVEDERWRKALKGMEKELTSRLNEALGEEKFKQIRFILASPR